MKITRLTITNIGLIAHESIEINKPLMLFYGDISQGKTTLINAVRWSLGGAFPADIIRHGEKEASIQLDFAGGSIRREFYVSPQDGITKAREIEFKRDGNPTPIKRPVEEIRKFLNPFLINQSHFHDMSEPARQRFLVDLLGVDTAELDAEMVDLKDQRTTLELKIAGYGDIDLTPVPEVDVIALRKRLADEKRTHAGQVAQWQTELDGLRAEYEGGKRKELREATADHAENVEEVRALTENIAELERRLANERENLKCSQANEVERKARVERLTAEVAALPDLKPQADAMKAKIATPLDTSAIDKQLEDAAANAVRVEEYHKRVAANEQRNQANLLLDSVKDRQKEIKLLKAQRLADIAGQSGVPGLTFDEDGNPVFEETTLGMISTSQSMKLSSLLSKLYPDGLGLELLDRGESLGKSIFGFVERAKANDLTILATIVGEKPATVPEDIGVWVVTEGKVTK